MILYILSGHLYVTTKLLTLFTKNNAAKVYVEDEFLINSDANIKN